MKIGKLCPVFVFFRWEINLISKLAVRFRDTAIEVNPILSC